MVHVPLLLVAGLVVLAAPPRDREPPVELPSRVEVLPVFLVPKGQPAPSAGQIAALSRHLKICQARYKTMLGGRDTFTIAEERPHLCRSSKSLAELRELPEDGAPWIASELLDEVKQNRYTCPYVFCCVLINPGEDKPAGGGRPLNGGFNTGGGIVILSSHGLDQSPNFQSTLQHELGHGFGLPHVDVYHYNMSSNDSIMSYNTAHHTRGFEPSPTPGRLIPEDLRGLALNRRAFSKLTFEPAHVPAGYGLAELVWLGSMTIPDQPPYAPTLTTPSGEDFGSGVGSIVGGHIEPSLDPKLAPRGTQTFNADFRGHEID